MSIDPTPPEPTGPVEDDRLRLIFICCHPALAPEARVALTLRLLGGLTVPEIAAAFLVSETTMGQRITRAKKKIAAAHIPYRVPEPEDLPARLTGVLAVLYLVFNEGYLASSGDAPVRVDLTSEAIRLCRVLRALLPTEPEVAGLLALMLLTDARREARFADGVLVPLNEQDRATWDGERIAEGLALVRECLAVNRPGIYQLQAAINAVHSTARTTDDTDWSQIAALYGQLLRHRARPRSSRSTGRWRSPSSTARPSGWPRSSGWTWPATTRGRPPGPTCCAASAAPTTPGRRTTPRSPPPTTTPSAPSSPAAATRSDEAVSRSAGEIRTCRPRSA